MNIPKSSTTGPWGWECPMFLCSILITIVAVKLYLTTRNKWLLGAVQHHLRTAYDFLSNGIPQGKSPVKTGSAKASRSWDSIGICKIHEDCRLFWLSYWKFLQRFLILLCQSYKQQLKFLLDIMFFLEYFTLRLNRGITFLKSLIWNY